MLRPPDLEASAAVFGGQDTEGHWAYDRTCGTDPCPEQPTKTTGDSYLGLHLLVSGKGHAQLSLEGCEMCLDDESSESLLLCWSDLYLRPTEAPAL